MTNGPGSPGTFSAETRKVRGQLGQGVRLLENPRGSSPWALGRRAAQLSRPGLFPALPPLPQGRPALPAFSWGVKTPARDPAHKALPVIGAFELSCAACGRVTGGRPAPAEDVPGSRRENSLSWGGRGGASRARELGAGGTLWLRPALGPRQGAGKPPPPLRGRRAGCAACRWGLAS